MRKSLLGSVFVSIVLLGLIVMGTSCAKKVAPPVAAEPRTEAPSPTPTPAVPAPTISLSASPSTIEEGQSSTLSWKSSNASGVTIDNSIGTVEPSGSRTIRPAASTTYTARATGPGGNAVAETRVTVTAPTASAPEAPLLSDAEIFATQIRDAFFDYDKYDVRPDAQTALRGNVRVLNERPNIRFTIEGHCDERGSARYNLALGDRRANSAKEFLVGQGVDASRIDTVSYGKERPFCEEQTEECWQLNRRAHFVLR